MLVVGTGAVASWMLSRLALRHPVQLFAAPSLRREALVQRWGLDAVAEGSEVRSHQPWLVVCKSWQNPSKIASLRSAPPPTDILVLQNGWQPERLWRAWGIPVERGLLTYGLRSVAPGQASGGEEGELILAARSPWLDRLGNLGWNLRAADDMRLAVWQKLTVNASLNVVAALHGTRNGDLLGRPALWAQVVGLAHEVQRIGQACGEVEAGAAPDALLERVARETRENVCSTLADLRSGRPTEYPEINGALLDLARQHGVEVPLLEAADREFQQLVRPGWRRAAS